MTESALRVEKARKMRGKACVLNDVDLSVAPGERVALLGGHNGGPGNRR